MNSRNVNINLTRVKFKNNHVVYENFAKCTIKDYEFNLSYNPTLLSGSQGLLVPYTYTSASYTGSETFYEITGSKYFGILKDFATGSISGSDFSPYVSTIGLYNDAQELLAVAKMAVPTPISPNTDMTFLVKFDTQWNNKPYFTPTPSPSRTPYPTQQAPSLTPTSTPTSTPTITPSVTPSVTPSISIGNSPSISTTPSVTPSITVTPSISITPSMTPSVTPSTSAPSTCGAFGTFTKDSGTGTVTSSSIQVDIYSSTTAGSTIASGSFTTTCENQVLRLYAFSGTGGSKSQGTTNIVNVLGPSYGNYSSVTDLVGPGGGLTDNNEIIISAPGTYTCDLIGAFYTDSNPPTTANRVWLIIDLP